MCKTRDIVRLGHALAIRREEEKKNTKIEKQRAAARERDARAKKQIPPAPALQLAPPGQSPHPDAPRRPRPVRVDGKPFKGERPPDD